MARSSSEPRGKGPLGCESLDGGAAGRFAATAPGVSALPRRSWTGCIPVAGANGVDAALPEKAVSEFAEIMGGSIGNEGYQVVNTASDLLPERPQSGGRSSRLHRTAASRLDRGSHSFVDRNGIV